MLRTPLLPELVPNVPPSSLLCEVFLPTKGCLGKSLYVVILCINYIIGYNMYLTNGWLDYHNVSRHTQMRIFGDLVGVVLFALVIVTLPWHNWEKLTCIKTKDKAGLFRFMAWWMGTLGGLLVYGHMSEIELFKTSLNNIRSTSQKNMYEVLFTTIGFIFVYWLLKLCPCGKMKKVCNPSMNRKVIFIRIFTSILLLAVFSYISCSSDVRCKYHLHHWWFGLVFVLLSSASLDNWFDYMLQGIFWTFLIEALFNYGFMFGEFFI